MFISKPKITFIYLDQNNCFVWIVYRHIINWSPGCYSTGTAPITTDHFEFLFSVFIVYCINHCFGWGIYVIHRIIYIRALLYFYCKQTTVEYWSVLAGSDGFCFDTVTTLNIVLIKVFFLFFCFSFSQNRGGNFILFFITEFIAQFPN